MEVGTRTYKNLSESNYTPFKLLHPKVLTALMQLKAPSPSRVVSDKLQPKSGDLKEKIRSFPIDSSCNLKEVAKKEVSLTLKRNSILSRRGIIEKVLP